MHNRRTFLKAAGATVLTTAVATSSSQAAGPALRHAVIGTGGQGRNHARTFNSMEGCDVVAVCDIDPRRRKQCVTELKSSRQINEIEDFRHILQDEDVDSVSIATPDHWHAMIAVLALQAGKHVYVEKPCAHNLSEARALLRAASQSGKCVQHGSQSRSGSGIAEAMDFLRSGALGEVRMAKAINHQLRPPIGRAPAEDPPDGANYDLWLGPAPLRPFTKNRWHYNWHWFWDYGTGDMGNDGIHQVDLARWGLGVTYPKKISAAGGQLFYDDDHETPDTQVVTFDFGKSFLVYEMRLWTDYKLEGHDNGNVFYCDDGILEIGRNGCEVTRTGEKKRRIGGGADFGGHIRNFIECARNGTPEKLNAPMDEALPSVALCHLGNIATRLGRSLEFDEKTFQCVEDEQANALFTRDYRKGYEFPAV